MGHRDFRESMIGWDRDRVLLEVRTYVTAVRYVRGAPKAAAQDPGHHGTGQQWQSSYLVLASSFSANSG